VLDEPLQKINVEVVAPIVRVPGRHGRQRTAPPEEILWICEAAHTPVMWVTQVLESLAKTGMPSRAEVTDAAMSERAECVMLNKVPFIREALKRVTVQH
jgi:pyruvate kinase